MNALATPLALEPLEPPRRTDRAVSLNYRWPTPPYSIYGDDLEQVGPEDCEFVSRSGRRLAGRMTLFLPEQGAFEFQLPKASTAHTIEFAQIRMLRLKRPLDLNADGVVLERLDSAVSGAPDRQKFELEFTDGEKLSGCTMGHVKEPFGLFIFLDEGDPTAPPRQVTRIFVPQRAVASFNVGEFIGQLLVREQVCTPEQVDAALSRQRELRGQRIGDYLLAHHIVNEEQLAQAIKRQESMPVMRLGEALVEMGMLTVTQLEDALTHQRENRSKLLGAILVEMGFISQDQLRHALAVKLGFPVVDISRFPVDVNALRQVPARMAGRLKMLPILLRDTMLVVALDDPLHSERLNQIRFLTQNKVVPVIAVGESMDSAIQRWYHKLGMDAPDAALDATKTDLCFDDALNFLPNAARADITELASALDAERPSGEEEENHIQEADNTLVRLVNTMILDAYNQGISDIHIESYPGKQKMRIRFRRDGTLQPYLELPASYRKAVIARIKIMADLDISERRKPQDGKIDFSRFGPARIELRVATIPTNAGLEDAVMRILASARPVPLENLGLSDYNRDNLKRIMTKSYGLFLICGPTGSGKTTTLHSALSYINVPERKIWTAEDPVEITQPGLRQVQVNPKIGWTFAGALRAFLRADPDVIMVGEMRDTETARIGVEASLTGHLVLSTLHTNSAPESVTRLLDMGLDPFNFADALLGVLAQRLAKRLCTKCRAEHVASDAELEELLSEYLFNMPPNAPIHRDEVLAEWKRRYAREDGHLYLYASAGCSECGGTGYRGRLGLHELLASSLEIKRLVQTRAPVEDIQRTSLVQGMRTLKQDGIDKTLQGHTDLAQVRAVTN